MFVSRVRGAGGYDIFVSRRVGESWGAATPVPFNTAARDFDPAFSPDGRAVYFCSDRPGGQGGDDLYRVPFVDGEFGEAHSLGASVNSARNEWAPMLSPDGRTLLFSSDGRGGAGRMDLFVATRRQNGFDAPRPLPGAINTAEDEFDATFLEDGATVVFTRAPDLRKDDVRLFQARPTRAGYDRGTALPDSVNTPGGDAYAPMLDWSAKRRLTFTTRRPVDSANGVDTYLIEYQWK
jgi:Tol biopolymer transport system component